MKKGSYYRKKGKNKWKTNEVERTKKSVDLFECYDRLRDEFRAPRTGTVDDIDPNVYLDQIAMTRRAGLVGL